MQKDCERNRSLAAHKHTHASPADHIAIQTALLNVNANACVYIFRLSSHKKIQATRGATSSPQPAVTRSSLVPACFAAGHDYVNRIMFAHSLSDCCRILKV